MNEEQQYAMKLLENQIHSVGSTPIQALAMGYENGYYEKLSDNEFKAFLKIFVKKFL